MRPRSGLAARLAAISAIVLAAVAPAPAAAQEALTPVPGAFCTLFTNEEAGAAFGIELVLTGISTRSCTWSPPGSFGSDVSLVPSIGEGTLAETKERWSSFPGGIEEITVGGQPALLRVNDDFWRSGKIFTEALGQVLEIDYDDWEGVTPDADIGAGLRQLLEAALPRMSSITFAEPTARPAPSFRTDPDLAARFPASIGGHTITVQTVMAADFFAAFGMEQEDIDQFNAALASQGKTIEDVSIGFGSMTVDGAFANIQAIRVRGGDGAALMAAFMGLAGKSMTDPQIGTVDMGGKQVTTIRDGADGQTSYYLPSGELVWVVQAEEPLASEIIAALPLTLWGRALGTGEGCRSSSDHPAVLYRWTSGGF